jgi:hypothetical protein
MVPAIRQTVTIQSAGRVEVRSPELRAGARAEVIVLLEAAECQAARSPLEALDALQESLQLTAPAAAEWAQRARAERQAFGQRSSSFSIRTFSSWDWLRAVRRTGGYGNGSRLARTLH